MFLDVRSKSNKVEALSSSNVRLNDQRIASPRHSRRESARDPSGRESSQNDVKIEEYDSDAMSGKESKSNSIRFVILKDDVKFEYPGTPQLRAVLKKKVDQCKQYPGNSQPLSNSMGKSGSKDDLNVLYEKRSSEDLAGTGNEGYSLFGANRNIPAKPSRFQKKAEAKLNRSDQDNAQVEVPKKSEPNKLFKISNPQKAKRLSNQDPRNLSIGGEDQANDTLQRADSINSGIYP